METGARLVIPVGDKVSQKLKVITKMSEDSVDIKDIPRILFCPSYRQGGMERQIIFISGPTASGKTEFSLNLAIMLNTEIISADSRQFYKYLDIGTAKPNPEELKSVNHHLISFLNPNENYNISIFRKDVLRICEDLWDKGKIPIISGGSGLYIKSIIDGLADTPDSDQELRDRLLDEMSAYGREYLYNKLVTVDPVSASKMLPQNWKRVIRALEVFYLTGKPIWEYHARTG